VWAAAGERERCRTPHAADAAELTRRAAVDADRQTAENDKKRMIPARDLRSVARARLRDAQVLLRAKRFDGAFYLCGYAVEVALKARICRALKWSGFPDAAHAFKALQSLKTHDLEILLRLSGVEARI
jgi:hypothetical protein